MKKEYCKPILEVVDYEVDRNIALDVSVMDGNQKGESFNGIFWEG